MALLLHNFSCNVNHMKNENMLKLLCLRGLYTLYSIEALAPIWRTALDQKWAIGSVNETQKSERGSHTVYDSAIHID